MTRKRLTHGFGLVELMVSITLGLLLTAAVIQTFIAANTTFRIQDSLSRVQETTRYAVHFLGRDLRMAGYLGCAAIESIPVNIISDNPPADVVFDLATVVTGTDNVAAGNALGAVAGTDVITLKRASSASARLTGNMTADNANIQVVDNSLGLIAGDYVLITDCLNADLFTATTVSKSNNRVTITHADNVNTTNRLSKAYGPDAEIFGFESVTYFIGDTGRKTSSGDPVLGLFTTRRTIGSGGAAPTAFELVAGIENMQVLYGEDTDDDNSVNQYRTEPNVSNWENVISVQVNLLIASDQENIVAESGSDLAQSITFNGNAVANNDGRYRRAVSYVFAIRNKLP